MDADDGDMRSFAIGGLVLEISTNCESPGLMKNSLEDFPTILRHRNVLKR